MKKLVIPLIILCFVLAFATVPAFGHLCSDPFVTDLIAGGGGQGKSAMDVGDIEVCNDGEYLYVTYLTDEVTCLIETHLHVTTIPPPNDPIPGDPGFPLTKKGNPIPGQFDYAMEHECVSDYTYQIPLGEWGADTKLYIAAHAVVETSSGTADACASFVQDAQQGLRKNGTSVLPARSEPNKALGPSDSPSGVENFFSLGYGGFIELGFLTLVGGNLTVWEITWGPYPLEEADVYVSRDGATWTWLGTANNKENPGSDPHPSTFSLPECVAYVKIVDTTNPELHNDQSDGFDVDAVCGDYNCQEETAWGEGIRFNDKNWATYFEYEVQEYCTNVPDVINGGFESPVVTTSQGWNIYDSGTEGLGWTVEWYDGSTSYGGQTRPEPAHLELHKSGTIVSSYEGDQYAELDTDWDGPGGGLNGEPASVKIYQDLDTCPDQEYTLTYAWSPRGGYLSKLEVYWDGDLVTTHEGSTSGWTLETFTVAASGTSTRLEFVETGSPDSFGMFLDDVRVEIPTP